MSGPDTDGVVTFETAPTEITDLEVSKKADYLMIRFHDNLESVEGSLLLSEETATQLRDQLNEQLSD